MKKKFLLLLLAVMVMLSLAACGDKSDGTQDSQAAAGSETSPNAQETYPNADLLTEAEWVQAHAKDSNIVIVDVRSKGYEQGHIPGAVSLKSGLLKDGDHNTVVGADKFQELVQNAGINSDTTVVLYDDGNSLSSGRVFYVLEYYGHKDKVKVLNGGYAAWMAASMDVSTDAPTPAKGNFVATADDKLLTTKEEIKLLDLEACTLLDVRSADEYSGADLRGNKKGGHIESAVNKDWTESIDNETSDGVPKFKPYKQLQEEYSAVGLDKDKTIIPYCQTNVRGAQSYFTLRLLGYKDVRPYEGSFAEWGNADDTEVVS